MSQSTIKNFNFPAFVFCSVFFIVNNLQLMGSDVEKGKVAAASGDEVSQAWDDSDSDDGWKREEEEYEKKQERIRLGIDEEVVDDFCEECYEWKPPYVLGANFKEVCSDCFNFFEENPDWVDCHRFMYISHCGVVFLLK